MTDRGAAMKRNDTTDGLLDGAEVEWDVLSGGKEPLRPGGHRSAVRAVTGNLGRLRGMRDGSDERERA